MASIFQENFLPKQKEFQSEFKRDSKYVSKIWVFIFNTHLTAGLNFDRMTSLKIISVRGKIRK